MKPEDIVILIGDAMHKSEYYAAMRHFPLPKPITWNEAGRKEKNKILVDTIQRFKGLEATIVFLWGIDYIDSTKAQELLYVGMSRAKSILYLVGKSDLQSLLD